MYAQSVIDSRLRKTGQKLGFEPEYHSVRDVAQANAHFNALVHPETGVLLRNLKTDEQRWIQNEITLCTCDSKYYATRYVFINDMENKLIRFNPTVAQRIMWDIWAELEEMGRGIEMQALKARQLGISTETEVEVARRVQFFHGIKAVVASSDPDKSAKMANMLDIIWDNMVWFLMPGQIQGRKGQLIDFKSIGSAVSIEHGTQFTGLARGWTPTVCHLSEVSEYADPEELIDASLFNAMHSSKWLFLVLESTAKGRKNWWSRTWQKSVQGWHIGRARLRPMFLPWFVGTDMWPTKNWVEVRKEALVNYVPLDITIRHAERARDYVRSNPLLSKYLGSNWIMPREQMFFWEVTREEYAEKKILNKFYEELCADDNEAFQSSNISVFEPDTIAQYRENSRSPLGVFGFVGDQNLIPMRMQPSRRDIRTDMPPLPVTNFCQLVPLNFTGYSGYDWTGKLFIWEMPEEDCEYGVGIDTAEGINKDRTVMEVVRKGTVERNDSQTAEFASPYVNAFDLAPLAFAVGQLYSVRYGMIPRRQAKMVIECKGNGEATQLELRKMGWSNFHQWVRYDSKRIRQANASKLGWFTVQWSRSMMLDYLIKAIRDEALDVNSPYFVDEMADLERDEFKQSLGASYGGWDDRIMALGFVFFSLHILEIRGNQPIISRQRQAQRESGDAAYPVWDPGLQGRDIPKGSPIRSYIRQYMPNVPRQPRQEGRAVWEPGRQFNREIER